MTISVSDWFLVWIGLEINILRFIALIYRRRIIRVEACIKYFFIQRLGSGLLIIIFYCGVNWFEYLILVILRYKMGGGPFYFWFPSICERIRWGRCLLLMRFQKVLPLLIVTVLVSIILWRIIIIRIVVGSVGSLNQKKIKRLMAYSSVHHIGWMLLGIYVRDDICFLYLLVYRLIISGIILILWKDKILEVGVLKNIRSKWSFSLGMLSIGGIPPILGFFLKWWVFFNLLNLDFRLLVIIILISVLIFYVYLRVVYYVIIIRRANVGWKIIEGKKILMGWDMIYLIGLNSGVLLWI